MVICSRELDVFSKIEDDDELSILSDSHGFDNAAPRSTFNGANAYSTPNRSIYSAGSATGNSREASGAPKSGNKRIAEVIDLTLNSDENNEPIIRAPKRQYQGPSRGSTLNFPRGTG
ncbi:hypothetical protein F5X99DRAFT_49184 [Biscogniauxia marginata]|nr:hypothetical protein F5X99DRAFT_49184 [Biscogniauxia marginata]